MTHSRRSILLLLILALSACSDSTSPDPFPNLVGSYTFDALFRDALASDVRARGTLTFTHVDPDTGTLIGTADIQLTVTGQQPVRFTAFDRASVAHDGAITFRLHLPDLVGEWRFNGVVSPSALTMQGNHALTVGVDELLGTWTAGKM